MLRKRSLAGKRMVLILTMLFLGLGAMGVSYASWTDTLQVSGKVTTGAMDMVFLQNGPYYLFVASQDGSDLYGQRNEPVAVWVSDDGKTAELSIAQGHLLHKQLTGSGDDKHYLRMEYPLTFGEASTVNTIELCEADFDKAASEQVLVTPADVGLYINQSYCALPAEQLTDYAQEIMFDVYRQTEVQADQLIGVIYLALTEESRRLLEAAPQKLTLTERDIPASIVEQMKAEGSKAIAAEVTVNYTLSLPLYIEQGHSEMWRASEKE